MFWPPFERTHNLFNINLKSLKNQQISFNNSLVDSLMLAIISKISKLKYSSIFWFANPNSQFVT
jgi:hypothetical protein